MEKGKIIAIVLLFSATIMPYHSAFGQWYLSFRTGYNQDAFGPKLGERGRIQDSTIFEENIYGTLAQGWNFNLEVGYFFTHNIGVQLDLGYLHGFKTDIVDYQGTAFGATAEQVITARTRQFRVAPQLVIRTATRLYARFGVTSPIWGVTKTYSRISQPILPGISTTIERETNNQGQFALGAIAAVGYELMLTDRLSMLFDVEYIGLTVKRQDFEVTSYTVDGMDLLSTLPDDQREGEYPEDEKSASPYSSISINVGVRWRFGSTED